MYIRERKTPLPRNQLRFYPKEGDLRVSNNLQIRNKYMETKLSPSLALCRSLYSKSF